MDRKERGAFWLLAVLLLVTAWNSYDFYQLDEHFQIIEFAGSKLGIVPVQNLPWEYEAGIRPWLQPFLFAGLCKALQSAGIDDRFLWTFFFRLFCAAWGFYAMLSVYRLGAAWFSDKQVLQRHLLLCTTLGFMPFLLVRTSSENMSASFFTIGAALLLKNYYRSDPRHREIPASVWLLSGLMLGVAFQFRYQIIIMIGGLGLWLLLIERVKWKYLMVLSGGFLTVFGIGLLVDRYGNGKWTFSFYNYFKVNLLEGKTLHFWADPFFAYFYLLLENIFAPIVLALLIALLVFWIRNPRHVLAWITLPFFVFHSYIGHKEDRFLFPLIPLTILVIHLVFFENGRFALPTFLHARLWHGTCKWLWRYNWFWLIFLCIFPFNIDFYINHQKYIYTHRNMVNLYYAVNFNPYHCKELIFSFYRPGDLHVVEVEDLSAMASIAEKNSTRDIYFFSKMPYLDNWPDDLGKRTAIVNASHFFFRWPWVVRKSTPILKYFYTRLEDVECPTLFKLSPRSK